MNRCIYLLIMCHKLNYRFTALYNSVNQHDTQLYIQKKKAVREILSINKCQYFGIVSKY